LTKAAVFIIVVAPSCFRANEERIVRGTLPLFVFVALSMVSACKTTDETIGGVLGGTAGAGAGYGLSSIFGGNSTTTALAVAGGAAVGTLLGTEIAAYLDEADQEKAAVASNKAITNGKAGQTVTWKSDQNPGVRGSTTVVDTGSVQSDAGRQRVVWSKDPKPKPRMTPSSNANETPTPRTTGDSQSGNSGVATSPAANTADNSVPAISASDDANTTTADADSGDTGRACKKISEVAYIQGKEVRQQRVFCQTASGGWEPMTA
jgi:surface antigen